VHALIRCTSSYVKLLTSLDRSGSVNLKIYCKDRNTSNYYPRDDWYLWYLRRRRTHGEAVPRVKYCTKSIVGLAANFIKSCSNCASPMADKRSKPLLNHVKVKGNVDASFFDDIKPFRDSNGMFISGSYSYLEHVRLCLVSIPNPDSLRRRCNLNQRAKGYAGLHIFHQSKFSRFPKISPLYLKILDFPKKTLLQIAQLQQFP
jgi:hypothetical protein